MNNWVTSFRCECSDPECPVNHGHLCPNGAVGILYRIDMVEDKTGIAFCEACANDAFKSGLFTDERPDAFTLAQWEAE